MPCLASENASSERPCRGTNATTLSHVSFRFLTVVASLGHFKFIGVHADLEALLHYGVMLKVLTKWYVLLVEPTLLLLGTCMKYPLQIHSSLVSGDHRFMALVLIEAGHIFGFKPRILVRMLFGPSRKWLDMHCWVTSSGIVAIVRVLSALKDKAQLALL